MPIMITPRLWTIKTDGIVGDSSQRMTVPRYRAVLFDLDGTLTDPYEGITRTFVYALTQVGAAAPDEATLRSWIGPPLHASLHAYLKDEALALRSIQAYRERYQAIGMYENRVYPGIPDLLRDLRAAGCWLVLATSKLHSVADAVLDHFALRSFFHATFGASPDATLSAKADIIAAALAWLPPAARSACVMIGDTPYDVLGARANGIPCIAVTYGYGAPADLEAANPDALARSVAELRALLLA